MDVSFSPAMHLQSIQNITQLFKYADNFPITGNYIWPSHLDEPLHCMNDFMCRLNCVYITSAFTVIYNTERVHVYVCVCMWLQGVSFWCPWGQCFGSQQSCVSVVTSHWLLLWDGLFPLSVYESLSLQFPVQTHCDKVLLLLSILSKVHFQMQNYAYNTIDRLDPSSTLQDDINSCAR